MPTSSQNKNSQATDQGNQSGEKGESTNFENQAHSTGHGIGLQSTTMTGSETQHIAKDTAHHRSFQEPAIFLQGRW